MVRSAKIAAVCLISCVCFSLVFIIAEARFHEEATGRHIDSCREAGHQDPFNYREGALKDSELRVILFSTGIALASFFVGFLFLGRIVFHF